MNEQIAALSGTYPAAAELLERHGDETLLAYLQQVRHRPLPDILPTEDLLEEVRDYVSAFFGSETAGECAEVLRRRRCMTTANHHHPAFEYMTVQDTILHDQWLRLQGETGEVVPVVACANLSLTSTLYPRGMVVYDCTLPEGRLRLPLYSWKLRRPCVAAIGGIVPEMVDNVLKRLPQEVRQGSITARMGDTLERFCREVLLSEEVQRYDTLREQTTVINDMISQRYFTDRRPRYIWMPMETITARLLARDLRREGGILHQMLFREGLRTALLRELDGVAGCWEGNTGGTHFFWGLDSRGIRFPLRLWEEAGKTVLAGCSSLGEDVRVPFTPQALEEGMREQTLLPGMFLCFLEMHFLRDMTVFGGYYQPTYLGQMRRGIVRALRMPGMFEGEAEIIESKANYMTLGPIYLQRMRGEREFPVSTAELLEAPVSVAEVEERLRMPVSAALETLCRTVGK